MQWINWNSFAARLQSTELINVDLFGLWQLRGALEKTSSARHIMSCEVVAASQWIIHSDKVLFKRLSDEDCDEDWERVTRTGPLYQGRHGLCLERWRFWSRRFREIGEEVGEEVEPDAKDNAIRAAEMMEALAGNE
jgi:hypothetical protein